MSDGGTIQYCVELTRRVSVPRGQNNILHRENKSAEELCCLQALAYAGDSVSC